MRLIKNISFNWKDYLFDLHISNDEFKDRKQFAGNCPENFAPNLLANIINQLFSRRCSDDVTYERLDEILSRSGLHRVAVLNAHGYTLDGIWHYSNVRPESVADITWEYDSHEKRLPGKGVSTVSRSKKIEDGMLLPMDGKVVELHPVDSWVLQREEKGYGALILVCCNEDNHKPSIQSVPIIYAEGNIGLTADYRTKLLEPEKTPTSHL